MEHDGRDDEPVGTLWLTIIRATASLGYDANSTSLQVSWLASKGVEFAALDTQEIRTAGPARRAGPRTPLLRLALRLAQSKMDDRTVSLVRVLRNSQFKFTANAIALRLETRSFNASRPQRLAEAGAQC